ncbi:MAG TPA: flagellar export chaperone FliS [Candidatus Dorea gallistercoris]|uniref:Flagellar export chaperone FliS n=1 Tax=Candidatus Dorea gallistercoris TaxID=2838542 RepID=A0A9D1RD22_9FIRM|nr:flagellar export chaperone FliS [Candidatus Dorea gallistercoris]
MNGNPYQRYKEETVMTMTQGELLLLLYDELLKRLRAAELLAEKEDYDQFEAQVTRAQEIIRYLKDTLDFNYPISNELYQFYDFFLVELGRIKAGRKGERIEKVKTLVQELRDSFEEAEKKEAQ